MNWNTWVRQIHRWLSIAFTVAVIINIVALVQKEPAVWVGLLALLPLAFLMLTGSTCSCCRMPPSGATRETPADRSERNGRQDVREVGEGRKEGRRQAGRREADSPRHRSLSG